MLEVLTWRALGLAILLVAGACGGGTKRGKLLPEPTLVGDTQLRVREVQPPTLAGEFRPNRQLAFYTADSDREVIPARFPIVFFMNSTVAFGKEVGQNYFRIRYDITGKTPARFTETPYTEIDKIGVGQSSKIPLKRPPIWYGQVWSKRTQGQPDRVDTAIFDEEGDVAATIADVHWKSPNQPQQQGEALVFSVGPDLEKPLVIITDRYGRQTAPLMTNMERFTATDGRYKDNNRNTYRIYSLPLGEGRYAPIAHDGSFRRITEEGLIGYRPSQQYAPDMAVALRGIQYWWKDYEIDGKKLTGWSNADLSEESGPLWIASSVQIVKPGNSLLAQREDGSWEFRIDEFIAPRFEIPVTKGGGDYRYDEFRWLNVPAMVYATQAEAASAVGNFQVIVAAEYAKRQAEENARWETIAKEREEARVLELARQKGFAAAMQARDRKSACMWARKGSGPAAYDDAARVLLSFGNDGQLGSQCGYSLEQLVSETTHQSPEIYAWYRRERANARAWEVKQQKERKAREHAENAEIARRQAEVAARAPRWGHYESTSSSSSSHQPSAREAYTKALQDWTYGRSQWKPVKY